MNLTGFDSSRSRIIPDGGIGNLSQLSPWADNQTVLTFPLNITDDKQLSLAGIKTYALCEFNVYDGSNANTDDGRIPSSIPNIEYYMDDHIENSSFTYRLRCAGNCSDSHNSSPVARVSRSSLLNIT